MMTRTHTLFGILAFGITLAAGAAQATTINNRTLANEQDGRNWASSGRTFSENHYSPLKQVNDGNVQKLGLAWYYDLPRVSSVFAAPIEVDGVLYFAIGYSVVHAIDVRTGKLLWKFDPEVYKVAGHKMQMGWGIRGIAYWEGKIYTGTQEGRLIALDAKTGKQLWSVQTIPMDDTRYITGPPWVFNGKVVIGFGGGDFGMVRGYVTAYDAKTGKQLWRFYTVPGNPADGFENDAMAMAAKTWTGEWWRFGGAGGTVWGAMAYDPKYNRLYFGTGNGSPWNQKIRSPGGGDNLFLCSIVALDADTGKYAWHYQVNPGESWDYNAAMDIHLADLTIDGKKRSVLMQAPKNGFFYVIDRENGKLISAEKFAPANWAERIDLATGRPVENPDAHYKNGPFAMWPGPVGAHSAQPMAFSQQTKLAYIPTTEYSTIYADAPDVATWKPKQGNVNNNGLGPPPAGVKLPPLPPNVGYLQAYDPVAQKQVWKVPQAGFVNGGVAATGGNLVFQGQATGEFRAYAADTGKVLWDFDAQTGIIANPITYEVDGRQYVTVIAGWRGMGGPSGAKPDWDYYTQPRRVLTFVLDGQAKLPPADKTVRPFVDDPAFVLDQAKVDLGKKTFNSHCFLCHGFNLVSGGAAPDLRKSPVPLSKDAITAVVHDGVLQVNGMPKFDYLTPEQIEAIQHYVRARAREAIASAQNPPTPQPQSPPPVR